MADMPTSLVIAYHADCIDGAASAWAVAQSFALLPDGPQPKITYIPYAHFNEEKSEQAILSAAAKGSAVYFVDVAPEKAFLDRLLTTATSHAPHSVYIFDHHKSAHDRLKDYCPPQDATVAVLQCEIDPACRSAARMIWRKLIPQTPPPPVLEVIDMMDGDAAGLKTVEDFSAAAYIDAHDIRDIDKAFDILRGLAALSFNDMVKTGSTVTEDQKFKLDKLMDQAQIVEIQIMPDQPPTRFLVVNGNVQHFGRAATERMNAVAREKGADIAMAWFMHGNGKISASLRTNGHPDLSTVIPYMNSVLGCSGGGHAGAGAIHFDTVFSFARAIPFLPQDTPPAHRKEPPARQP